MAVPTTGPSPVPLEADGKGCALAVAGASCPASVAALGSSLAGQRLPPGLCPEWRCPMPAGAHASRLQRGLHHGPRDDLQHRLRRHVQRLHRHHGRLQHVGGSETPQLLHPQRHHRRCALHLPHLQPAGRHAVLHLRQDPAPEGLRLPAGHQCLAPLCHHWHLLVHPLGLHEQPDWGLPHPLRPGQGRHLRQSSGAGKENLPRWEPLGGRDPLLGGGAAGAVLWEAEHHRRHCDHLLPAGLRHRRPGLPGPRVGVSPQLQAHVPVLHLAHLCAGHPGLRHHDVPHQPHLRLGQRGLHGAAAAGAALPVPEQQLGLHQPGPHLPPGPEVPADAGRPQGARQVLAPPDAADGAEPPVQPPADQLHQRPEEERPVRAGPRGAGRARLPALRPPAEPGRLLAPAGRPAEHQSLCEPHAGRLAETRRPAAALHLRPGWHEAQHHRAGLLRQRRAPGRAGAAPGLRGRRGGGAADLPAGAGGRGPQEAVAPGVRGRGGRHGEDAAERDAGSLLRALQQGAGALHRRLAPQPAAPRQRPLRRHLQPLPAADGLRAQHGALLAPRPAPPLPVRGDRGQDPRARGQAAPAAEGAAHPGCHPHGALGRRGGLALAEAAGAGGQAGGGRHELPWQRHLHLRRVPESSQQADPGAEPLAHHPLPLPAAASRRHQPLPQLPAPAGAAHPGPGPHPAGARCERRHQHRAVTRPGPRGLRHSDRAGSRPPGLGSLAENPPSSPPRPPSPRDSLHTPHAHSGLLHPRCCSAGRVLCQSHPVLAGRRW
ncbi:collagen alpha-1(I) chain-like isoform X2 [Mauremys mutica]|uniref:collagen alpha-1(I) chain-like isoform X2 n=1 Tax=Mauremys mutica TaxID=74926 RepID=UPI001D16ACEB|nr:collagen alpha-1(I) chain-like isoform X2 [Mauremys mutica]